MKRYPPLSAADPYDNFDSESSNGESHLGIILGLALAIVPILGFAIYGLVTLVTS